MCVATIKERFLRNIINVCGNQIQKFLLIDFILDIYWNENIYVCVFFLEGLYKNWVDVTLGDLKNPTISFLQLSLLGNFKLHVAVFFTHILWDDFCIVMHASYASQILNQNALG